MDDSQSCAFGKDPSGNKPSDSPGEIKKPDRLPELTLESERGAGGSDEASDSKVNPGENERPALPENQGVESSNTTPSNHQCLTMSPIDTLSAGGLDWLSLSIHGVFNDSYWELIQEQFEYAKQNAIDKNILESFVKLPTGLELQVAPNGKRRLLIDFRWGKRPDPELGATRVEFQIRRDHLRDQHCIIDYEDLITKRHSLTRWLTHHWLRFTDTEPKPGHSDRIGPSALWQKVIDAFDSWTGKGIEERSKRTINDGDISHLLSMVCGCLTSALAKVGVLPRSHKELEYFITKMIAPNYDTMIHDVDVKRKILVANKPYDAIKMEELY